MTLLGVSVICSLVCAGPVLGSPSGPADASRVIGGDLVESCTWPSTGQIFGFDQTCSASLVHPNIILTAAHCTNDANQVWFGDSLRLQTSKRFKIKACVNHPDFDEKSNVAGKHTDLAYCVLHRPVVGVPITPILMGCELDALQPGTPVYQVGFGATSDKSDLTTGNKRQVLTTFNGFSKKHFGEALVGEPGKGPCHGDSGGPVFVQLPESKFGENAGWRVFGITSGGDGGCTGEARFGVMSTFVEFVENDSGLDITPCTDADGSWNPGPLCKEAPLNPFAVSGDWVNGCSAAPVGGFIKTCGKPFDPDGDNNGSGSSGSGSDVEVPKTSIVSPSVDQKIPFGVPVEVRVTASDNGEIAEVELFVDGASVGVRRDGPYRWRLESLTPGTHSLQSEAKDRAGNIGKGELVAFTVLGESESQPGQGDGGEPNPGDAAKGDETKGDGDIDSSGSVGCKMSSGNWMLGGSGALALLLFTFRIRD